MLVGILILILCQPSLSLADVLVISSNGESQALLVDPSSLSGAHGPVMMKGMLGARPLHAVVTSDVSSDDWPFYIVTAQPVQYCDR